MNINAELGELAQVVSGFVPINLATGANSGDWVSLKNYERITFIFFKGAGTAGDDPTITIQEATAVAGTGAQDLAVISRVYVKQGADLAAVGQFTLVEQAAAATYTDATSAELQAIWMIDVLAEQLSDGFDCIRANVSDVGTNAQIGGLLYVMRGARFGGHALPSAIID